MIDFKKELENFKPCMNTDEVEEAIYGSDLKDLTDIMREVIEEFRENEGGLVKEKDAFVKQIKEEIKGELQEEQQLTEKLSEGIEKVEEAPQEEKKISEEKTVQIEEKTEIKEDEEVQEKEQEENKIEEDKGEIE